MDSDNSLKVKKTVFTVGAALLIVIGLAIGIFTCCADPGIGFNDQKILDWERVLADGTFIKTGESFSCPYTKIRTNSSGMVTFVFNNNDTMEGTLADNKISVGSGTSYDVSFSEKSYTLRIIFSDGYADFTYSQEV